MNGEKHEQPIISYPIRTIALLIVLVFVLAEFTPPSLLWPFEIRAERRQIYADAKVRVEKAGGWQAIETATKNFYTTSDIPEISWYWLSQTNPLPPEISALHPMYIQLAETKEGYPVLHLHLAGIHRTGTYSQPLYEILVICTNIPAGYVPPINSHFHIERKGDAIFELR